MRVQSVQLENVGVVRGSRDVALDAAGVLLVTGPNGSGKSSVIEGVALGLWGESLRGAPLWRDGEAGSVRVVVHTGKNLLVVTRRRTKGGRVTLSFTVDDQPAVEYETPTKAQDALTRLVGTFASWRRTHVLSSSDSAHFSLATDAERKRLLEALLGLDRFDAAAATSRTAALSAKNTAALAEQETRAAELALSTARARLVDADTALAAIDAQASTDTIDLKALESELAAAKAARTVAQEEERDVAAVLQDLTYTIGQHTANAASVRKRLEKADRDACPTCEQGIPDHHRARIRAEVDAAVRDADDVVSRLTRERDAAKATAAELAAEVSTQTSRVQDALGRLRAAEAKVAAARSQQSLRATLSAQRAESERRVAAADKAHAAAAKASDAARTEEATARAVATVLGTKGVRAHLLDTALGAAERAANDYLTLLSSSGARVELRSVTEKKAGGVSEALSLRVSIRRGEPLRPYDSLSGGERRRVDVALLLALAEAAGVAQGREPGTLWLDEVFDALDVGGCDAVSRVVSALGKTRAVVLITHVLDGRGIGAQKRLAFDTPQA